MAWPRCTFGTIHGFCLNLLQQHLPEYFKYRVLNDVQARLLVDRASTKSGLTDLGLRRWVESRLYLEVLGVLREADVDYEVLKGHPVLGSLEKYEDVLDGKRSLDYTEIMLRAVSALFDMDDLQRTIAKQVRYLTVDEYQDVNPLQEALIWKLHELGANVCVVGDDDQTIYQWRGSNVANILTYADRYPNVVTETIEENFRSSEGVVDGARGLIENNNPDRLRQGDDERRESQSFSRGDVLCQQFSAPDEEVEWIAAKILDMIGMPFMESRVASPRTGTVGFRGPAPIRQQRPARSLRPFRR